jgi:hypothetical protein
VASALCFVLIDRRIERPEVKMPRKGPAFPPTLGCCIDSTAADGRTGRWPPTTAGPVPAAPGEVWANVEQAHYKGLRGLPGGERLARLLARERGHGNIQALPRLTEAKILRWVKEHFLGTGTWPTKASGPVVETRGEYCGAVVVYPREGAGG